MEANNVRRASALSFTDRDSTAYVGRDWRGIDRGSSMGSSRWLQRWVVKKTTPSYGTPPINELTGNAGPDPFGGPAETPTPGT